MILHPRSPHLYQIRDENCAFGVWRLNLDLEWFLNYSSSVQELLTTPRPNLGQTHCCRPQSQIIGDTAQKMKQNPKYLLPALKQQVANPNVTIQKPKKTYKDKLCLHTNNQLPGLPGSALQVSVGGQANYFVSPNSKICSCAVKTRSTRAIAMKLWTRIHSQQIHF